MFVLMLVALLLQGPRDVQLEARNLFARHKTLLETEPPDEIMKALMKRKPAKKTAVDYNYLLQNF